jgi:hypothetical protein
MPKHYNKLKYGGVEVKLQTFLTLRVERGEK